MKRGKHVTPNIKMNGLKPNFRYYVYSTRTIDGTLYLGLVNHDLPDITYYQARFFKLK